MNNIILKGIVGSTAYGLHNEDSDIDYMGIFAPDTKEILGLDPPADSVVTKDPDTTLHEAKKFVTLALDGNPSVTELLWLDTYEQMTETGADLVAKRHAFLSRHRVRDAYLGYAASQFKRLEGRCDGSFSANTRKRTEKHARHLVRLVEQGLGLYVTGELVVDLNSSASPVTPETVRAIGEEIARDAAAGHRYLVGAEKRFKRARTFLPDQPNLKLVERWLMTVRHENWNTPPVQGPEIVAVTVQGDFWYHPDCALLSDLEGRRNVTSAGGFDCYGYACDGCGEPIRKVQPSEV